MILEIYSKLKKINYFIVFFITGIQCLPIIASTTYEEYAVRNYCDKNDPDINCDINQELLPPLDKLPLIHQTGPIKIDIIPYKKKRRKTKSFRSRKYDNFLNIDDSYLYEMR